MALSVTLLVLKALNSSFATTTMLTKLNSYFVIIEVKKIRELLSLAAVVHSEGEQGHQQTLDHCMLPL